MIPNLIVGNWKMNKTPSETEALLSELMPHLTEAPGTGGRQVEVVLAPPFTSLPLAARFLAGTGIALAGQDCHWSEEGPYTGDVSARMLVEVGCRYVILGHSERRELCGETDHKVNLKAKQALFWGLTPIICVGEKIDERESGRAEMVVERQVELCLADVALERGQRLAVADEPVWAIGSGRTPAPSEVESVHHIIRSELASSYGPAVAPLLPILYGGSVTEATIEPMLQLAVVDGVLVGGASLSAESFLPLVERARSAVARPDPPVL